VAAAIPSWFVPAICVVVIAAAMLGLIQWALRIMGGELHHIVDAVKSEFIELIKGELTTGSINIIGVLLLAVFGGVVAVLMSTQKVFGLVFSIFGSEKATELVHYTDYMTLVIVVCISFIISLVIVAVDNRKP
jgi:hypothetical protein